MSDEKLRDAFSSYWYGPRSKHDRRVRHVNELFDELVLPLLDALEGTPCHCETLLDNNCYRCEALSNFKTKLGVK